MPGTLSDPCHTLLSDHFDGAVLEKQEQSAKHLLEEDKEDKTTQVCRGPDDQAHNTTESVGRHHITVGTLNGCRPA